MHHPGLDWSTLDHVSTPCNFCCCCGFPLGWIVSGLFSPSICPLELNNGVCMVDNGVRITKGGDGGGVVQCGAMELWSYGAMVVVVVVELSCV